MVSDWGYATREPLYAGLTLDQWKTMLESEDPDDRDIREAHGFGYAVPDHPDSELCRNGCGETYGEIISGKMRTCVSVDPYVTRDGRGFEPDYDDEPEPGDF